MPWQRYDHSLFIGPRQKKQQKHSANSMKSACVEVIGGPIGECISTPVEIVSLRTGAIAKIPVVLAELTLKINIDSIITLPEPALEIKTIKKSVKIIQCVLLQDTNTLFIKGQIRKNIDYSTRDYSNNLETCGDIRHCTVDIPFKCTTQITFNGVEPLKPVSNTQTEIQYFRSENLSGPNFIGKDKLLSDDFSASNKVSTEYYNELPYCELVSSKIVEFDKHIKSIHQTGKTTFSLEKQEFKSIEEKMVIYLTLKILQNRNVAIGAVNSLTPYSENCKT